MQKLSQLYEGKAKKLFTTENTEVLWVEYLDQATAGNGARKEQIKGKGRLNNRITAVIFNELAYRGIASHFISQISDTEQLVRRMEMFPLEIIMRNIAAGSFARRYGREEGTLLSRPVLELCLKDDTLGDPFINTDDVIALDLATRDQLDIISAKAREINHALTAIFNDINVTLVDFKVEMGRTSDGTILLAVYGIQQKLLRGMWNTSIRICSGVTWGISSRLMKKYWAGWKNSMLRIPLIP